MAVTAMAVTIMMMMAAVAMTMFMAVMMRVPAAGISPAFWIERRFNVNDARAEALQHVLDDMIAADAQLRAGDLRGQMPVADMPGDADHVLRIAGADFSERLRRGDNLDEPPVLERECIAAAQRGGFLQVQQELQPAHALHDDAAAVPAVEVEHNHIGGLFAPGSGGFYDCCLKHGFHGSGEIQPAERAALLLIESISIKDLSIGSDQPIFPCLRASARQSLKA